MRLILLLCMAAVCSTAQITAIPGASGGGGAPSGSAGGDLSGTYPNPTVAQVNGTTVPTNSAADQLLRTSASAVASWATVANCTDTGGNHLNYNTSTHAFSCGTSSGAGGSASGDLSGSYPGPTVAKVNGTTVPVNSAADQLLGTTASATGAWASVPSCSAVGQSLQYNTSTHAFSCVQNGLLSFTYSGTDVVCANSGDTPANGGSCTVNGSGSDLAHSQTLTLPVANLAVNRIFRIVAHYTSFSAATLPTLTAKVKVGSTVLYTASAAIVGTTQSEYALTVECVVTASSSSNTTLYCAPLSGQGGGGAGGRSTAAMPTASLAFGTGSANQTISFTEQFSSTQAGNYIYLQDARIEQIN